MTIKPSIKCPMQSTVVWLHLGREGVWLTSPSDDPAIPSPKSGCDKPKMKSLKVPLLNSSRLLSFFFAGQLFILGNGCGKATISYTPNAGVTLVPELLTRLAAGHAWSGIRPVSSQALEFIMVLLVLGNHLSIWKCLLV